MCLICVIKYHFKGDTPEAWALEWENYRCATILAEAARAYRDKKDNEEVIKGLKCYK